jgi:sugar phosphate isomerase/epimerase
MSGGEESKFFELSARGGYSLITIGSKIDEIRIDGSQDALQRDLEYFAAIGQEALEIPVHGLDVIKNGRLDERRVDEVLRILKNFDFIYSVHSPNPLNLMDQVNPELHFSVFAASLEFAAAVGSRILVYHAGRFIPEETFPLHQGLSITEELAHRLRETEKEKLIQLAEEYPQVTICIENARTYLQHSPYCYGEKMALLQEQVEHIGRPNVRITLDLGHLYMASVFYEFDPVRAVQESAPLIFHTHVHDNFGGSVYYHEKNQTHLIPFGRGDAHMPVGWGQVPIAYVLSAYLSSYPGLLIMELRHRYFSYTKESQENLKALLKSIPHLPAGY